MHASRGNLFYPLPAHLIGIRYMPKRREVGGVGRDSEEDIFVGLRGLRVACAWERRVISCWRQKDCGKDFLLRCLEKAEA